MGNLGDRVEAHTNRRTGGDLPVVVVAGATGSGKSAAALDIAVEFGGTIINADSMQVYRELRVLTARPTDTEMAQAPHALYGVMPAAKACSAGIWAEKAHQAVAAAHQAGRLPVLVGGTGLYLKAFEEGLAQIPALPGEVLNAAKRELASLGAPAFHAALATRDPEAASRIPSSDSQRMLRAWSVLAHTGRTLSAWQQDGNVGAAAGLRFLKLLFLPDRDALYPVCDQRFRAMVANGAIEEVERLLALGLDPSLPVMRAVGVRELAAFLGGDLTEDQMIAQGQTATRQYAKRQFTWFGRQMVADQVFDERYDAQYSESLRQKIFTKIRYFS
jgi:tRNA dimethylallyltransferase